MVELTFTVREQDIELWRTIFQSLEEGMPDALLQDKMEIFGEAVDAKLEAFLDEFGMENTFRVEYFSHEHTDFKVGIYFNTSEQMDAIVELISLCPVANLQINDDVDM
jgi:hypothetical protein